MNNYIKYLVLITAAALAGCTTFSPELAERKTQNDHERRMERASIAAGASTLIVKCGDSGCPGLHVEYRDPNAAPLFEKETNGWDFANTAVREVSATYRGAAPWLFGGKIVSNIMDGVGNNYTNSHNTDSTHEAQVVNSTNTTTTTTERETIIQQGNDTQAGDNQ